METKIGYLKVFVEGCKIKLKIIFPENTTKRIRNETWGRKLRKLNARHILLASPLPPQGTSGIQQTSS